MKSCNLTILFVLFVQFGYSQTNYYLSDSGNDAGDGSIGAPWKSLSKISSVALSPGDAIHFNKGDRFNGHFVVNGSGTFQDPILITSYGSGDKPIITGEVGVAGNGDFREAILVQNNDNIVFDGLQVQNERLVTRSGIGDKLAYGIQIINNGTRNLKNFIFRNLTIQDVYAVEPITNPDDFDGLEVSGIRVFSAWNPLNNQRNIQDVLVEDCYFADIQRLGVHFKHGGNHPDSTGDFISRIANVICRNNVFYYLGGTSVLPQRTYNCLIENNIFDHPGDDSDPRMPGRGSSVWPFRSINTVIQYNQCLSTRGYLDSHGIHIDHFNENTFVQYNYMEDCEGGFVEVLEGNKNSVYRFNVSVNDGWRNGGGKTQAWANSNHTFWVNKGNYETGVFYWPDETYIYNNTIVLDYNYDDPHKKETTAIQITGENTYVFNNIFQSINLGKIGKQQVVVDHNNTQFFMSNNLFDGAVEPSFVSYDINKTIGAPLFTKTGDRKYQYQIQENSPAINNGLAMTGPAIPGAGIGVFIDVPEYPTVDFYGNPINLSTGTPNIGACNAKNGETVLSVSAFETGNDKVWKIFPNPVKSRIFLKKSVGTISTNNVYATIANVNGQLVQEHTMLEQVNSKLYAININSTLTKGIYIITIYDGKRLNKQRIIIGE